MANSDALAWVAEQFAWMDKWDAAETWYDPKERLMLAVIEAAEQRRQANLELESLRGVEATDTALEALWAHVLGAGE